MNLHEDLLRGIYGYGYEKPSMIQQRAIVPLAKGLDIIAQSQSGTGKTGSFSVGLLQRVDPSFRGVQALVLEPTRELADQSAQVITHIGQHMSVSVHLSVGGVSVGSDASVLRKGAHVVVGTPGRVLDLIRRGYLELRDLKVVVLDEADEMLSQGFQETIKDIFHDIPKETQVALFSATLPPWTVELASKFMNDPLTIIITKEELTLAGIRQYYVDVEKDDFKFATLCDLFEFLRVSQSVVFVNTRRKAVDLVDRLNKNDFTVSCIHSDLSPDERKQVMNGFREGSSRVLVATDLIARGIDVQGVSVVVNYDITRNFENYIHRIGRGGRFGRKGLAINFVTAGEHHLLRELQAFYNTEIPELPSDFKA